MFVKEANSTVVNGSQTDLKITFGRYNQTQGVEDATSMFTDSNNDPRFYALGAGAPSVFFFFL